MARRRRPRAVEAVVLWPGAGSSSEHPSLVALEQGLSPLPVVRVDFPYRLEGRRAPDRAPKLLSSLRSDLEAICRRLDTSVERLVIGGRSMGGRMCSMAVAGADGEPPVRAAGLLLIAYPLHPPAKPDRLRVEHLPDIAVPTLFVGGDRDPFGTPAEMALAQELIRGPVTNVVVPGARHELKDRDGEIVAAVRDWVGPPRR